MKEKKIILVSCGPFEKEFLRKIGHAVDLEFRIPVEIEDGHIDLEPFYSPGRRQYEGNKLLQKVSTCTKSDFTKIVGLFRVDLFIPILTYIFGQAMLRGDAAVVSVYRLKNELYGMRKNDALLLDRTIKEVVHELGHTFGLIHCHVPNCVMRSSTYVEDIDQKTTHLCLRCRKAFEEVGE
ncbi:MAG: archaemetzincin family Zn-dependent metalloprotease [Bacteroidales bacterium]|nr:archaemetzincin family Zn-dependent metalloprotease [Bacteroidales bacterium]